MVVPTCNPSSQEAEAEGSPQVWYQSSANYPKLHKETTSQKKFSNHNLLFIPISPLGVILPSFSTHLPLARYKDNI